MYRITAGAEEMFYRAPPMRVEPKFVRSVQLFVPPVSFALQLDNQFYTISWHNILLIFLIISVILNVVFIIIIVVPTIKKKKQR